MNEKNVYTQYTTEKPEVFEFSHRITAVELPASLDQGLATHLADQGHKHPAFFFLRDGDNTLQQLQTVLIKMLRERYQVQEREVSPDQDKRKEFAELLKWISEHFLQDDSELVIFLDALDEAQSPSDVARFLPSVPPRNVFLFLTSRPPMGNDYLSGFTAAGAEFPVFDAHDQENRDNIETFLRQELSAGIADDVLMRLVDSSAGRFQLAETVCRLVERGILRVAELSSIKTVLRMVGDDDKLLALYKHAWGQVQNRLCEREILTKGQAQYRHRVEELMEFLRLLAAALGPLSNDQVCRWCGWSRAEFDENILGYLGWLVDTVSGHDQPHYQLAHPSVRDYLVPERISQDEVQEKHAVIARYYLDQAQVEKVPTRWRNVDAYGRFYAVRHMIRSKDPELIKSAEKCLINQEYLAATLGADVIETTDRT